eukprot:TRINITY_DN5029_c0_g1_i1.p1 TRINITY_DN5029_c0_g1~~TRINITY_DN5029_c0_g1_i1.p1  ORF type:complete len:609 (+),score=201.74 TRINITY_DN5029_c0_g1_i1:20-1846(+)
MSERLSVGLEPLFVSDIEEVMKDMKKQGFDFVVVDLSHPRNRRSQGLQVEHMEPFTRSDKLLSSNEWGSQVIGKLSDWISPDSPFPHVRRNSEMVIKQEMAWASHLGLPAVMAPEPQEPFGNWSRLINQTVQSMHFGSVWARFALTPRISPTCSYDSWETWNSLRLFCEGNSHLYPVLELSAELPDEGVLERWRVDHLKAFVVPTSIFLTNRKGFPTLSKRHQTFIQQLFDMRLQVILSGPSAFETGYHYYLQYLQHLFSTKPVLPEVEQMEIPYRDYLQSPLQPLMDNLESQTYETFEKDPVKYWQYEQAIHLALSERDHSPSSQGTCLMVVGAGRGPIVMAALRAASRLNIPPAQLRVYAVEKNPNAIVTLLNLKKSEGWGSQVTIVSSDMRTWEAPEKADLLVSELLGSFGDNELSPECLDGAQRFLKEGGISIPQSYMSYLAPMSSQRLWTDVKAYNDLKHLETAYVVKVHNAHILTEPQEVFEFVHPNIPKKGRSIDNNRYKEMTFLPQINSTVHGFIGYFDATLYKDVHMSILPSTFSEGQFSWFPIYFPLRQPVGVKAGEKLVVHMWRMCSATKVWYEWSISEPYPTPIHNPTGRSYWIGL